MCATFIALAAGQLVDDLILSDRGVLVHARLVRVNEGKPGDTVNVVLSGWRA
jgi:hypothetical protein